MPPILAGRIRGYFGSSRHPEQGPVLEGLHAPVGVVQAIAGQSRLWVILRGAMGTLGTLPTHGRAAMPWQRRPSWRSIVEHLARR